jgi:pimeloyl-ACP methyl ester carboxylesterase
VSLRKVVVTITITILLCVAAAGSAVWNLASPNRTPVGGRPVDVPIRDVEFTSRGAAFSGVTLRGWFVQSDRHRGVIVLLHGIRANRQQMVDHARFLHRAGYSSLLCDSRAHGESGGDAITFGHLESEDARAEVALARSLAPGEPVAVIGVSLGGAAALLAKPPLDIDAMILESVYPSIDRAIENRLRGPVGGAAPLFAPMMLAMIRPRLGFGADELRPIDHVGSLKTPKLFMFGTTDRDTTPEESMEMFNAAAGPKQVWAVEGAGHVDLCGYAGGEYERRVMEFLETYVGGVR